MTRRTRWARGLGIGALAAASLAACTGVIGDAPLVELEGTSAQGESALGQTPLRRLTREQYDNTVRDLLGIEGSAAGFAPDEQVGAFHSNAVAPVAELTVEQYMAAAEAIAASVNDVSSLLPCDPTIDGEASCVREFIEQFGRHAYRRPLSADEIADLETVFAVAGQGDFEAGIRLVIQAALQSPWFLYHVELSGEEAGDASPQPVGDFELASRLSYFLWSSMPDDALFSAAEAGELSTLDGLREQAERMIDDGKAAATIRSFHLQWLGLTQFGQVTKDPEAFPEFDDEMRAAMLRETTRFADYVIREGDGKLATLLSASWSFPEGPLLDLYGASPTAAGGTDDDSATGPGVDPGVVDAVTLNPLERAGLLTHASLLAHHAHATQSSPVHRGVIVRENFFCQTLPTPPEDVNNTPPDPDPNLTTRERFAEHTEDPACASCHKLIDGVGFGFENYDAIGRYRAIENGKPVDASGEIVATPDMNGPFDGVVELANLMATSETVRRCVTSQWFRYAFGRIENDADEAQIEAIYQTFEASGFDVRELILAIVTSDAFRRRVHDLEVAL